MSVLTYMQRRSSGTYEFRKRLPEILAGKPVPPHMRDAFSELVNPATGSFKREMVRSLGTNDEKAAKRLNHREALRVTQLFDAACNALAAGAPPRPQLVDLRELEAGILTELLSADADERAEGDDRRRLQTSADRARWPDLVPAIPSPTTRLQSLDAPLAPGAKGMAVDHFEVYGELLGDLEDDYREAWARSDPSIVRAETRAALKQRGVPFDETSSDFREAGLIVLRAHVRAYELMRQRQSGQIVDTPVVVPRDRGPKLSEALASWKAGGTSKRGKRPAAKSVVEAERALRLFKGLHGDLHLGDVTREHARLFRDALAQTPKALPKALRDLPLSALMKRDDLSQYPLRSSTTVNKLMSLLGGVVSQSERDGVLDKVVPTFVNPFNTNMQLRSEDGEESREPFDRTDLKAIFTSAVYTSDTWPDAGGAEAAFWFPLIALLSGMRLDEIAQLRICDLKHDDETRRWFFDVSRVGGRRTKNIGSVRRVPVHSDLIRIGLLHYRQSLLDTGAAPDSTLWPGVQNSAQWSKWFGRQLRGPIGITDRKKVFHSFRHTFKRMCRDAGVSEELHDALTGHTGGGRVGRTYGRGFSLSPLTAAMGQIEAPLDLKFLEWTPQR